MGGLIASLAGTGVSAIKSDEARATTVAGAESQARIEEQALEAGERQFEKDIERQQPFLDVGTDSISDFISAISNKADVSDLPATKIQSSLIGDFLGPEAPQFVKDKAITNLNAVEAEKNKGRLADLISIALGGTGSVAGSRVDLGTQGGRSLSTIGGITAQGLSDSAINRQNTINQTIGGAGDIPAFIAANRGGNTGVTNPNVTRQNPLGLTSGQGL